MSWSDDIRCLYCDGRLPLYRKITNGQFCSTAHRKAYWAEQERLAVERLHQTHDCLRAYQHRGPVEAILGIVEPEPPVPLEISVPEERPAWLAQVNAGEVPVGELLKGLSEAQPRWIEDRVAGDPQPLVHEDSLRRPVNVYSWPDCAIHSANTLSAELLPEAAPGKSPDHHLAPLQVTLHPIRLQHDFAPLTSELEPSAPGDPAPRCEKLFSLSCAAPVRFAGPAQSQPEPIITVPRPQLPLDTVSAHASLAPAALVSAGLRDLPVDRAAMRPRPSNDLRAIDLDAEPPHFDLSTPPLRPRLRLAAGRRYKVEGRVANLAVAPLQASTLSMVPPAITLPERQPKVLRSAPAPSKPAVQFETYEPSPSGLLPLACAGTPSQAAPAMHPAPPAMGLPQALRTEPVRPASKLEPMDAKPVADLFSVPEAPQPAAAIYSDSKPKPDVADKTHVWTHATDFWKRAPRDLKWLVFAIPVLLGLAMHPSLPKVRVAAPTGPGAFQSNFKNVVNQRLGNVRETMHERAAVALDEDFRSGLDEWVSRGDATTDWSFDATGFVRPGPLAMYRPSMNLRDYQLQFLGMIDQKSLSWVVRAVDFDNYYVVKMMVLKSGPLPTIGLTRYAVINGKADSRSDTMIPVDARTDTLYRVRMDMHGDDFALSVQGQMVDSWSEPRLSHGGVGFFAAPGEESRLRWVQVTHQYDMLGRLCAYLAPYNNITSSTSGSWQQ